MRILLFLLCVMSMSSTAAIYESTDNNGVIIYSDTPTPNAKELDIPVPKTVKTFEKNKQSTEAVSTTSSSAAVLHKTKKPYTIFNLTSPTDQQTIQNERDIPVQLTIEPKLQKGDKVQLMVDGIPRGAPEMSTVLHLLQLDRGMHKISAALIDENQKVIKQTNIVTIYILYAHLGTP